jgi:hypothetical protein
MTIQIPRHQGEMGDPFAFLSPYEFVLLTTFRTSGVGVPTCTGYLGHPFWKSHLKAREQAFPGCEKTCSFGTL